MKRILKSPITNAACLCLFSAFYAIVFLITARSAAFKDLLYYDRAIPARGFWSGWSGFLAAGHHAFIAYAALGLTLLVVLLLLRRRRPYDEYHTAALIQCLAVASVLVLIAIAGFYLMMLSDANGIVEKFTLFIVIHWVTVVLADLVFVLACRWR